jgi:hypothetical protein
MIATHRGMVFSATCVILIRTTSATATRLVNILVADYGDGFMSSLCVRLRSPCPDVIDDAIITWSP